MQQPEPPGPRGHRLFGNRYAFSSDPLSFLSQCAQKYGDLVKIAEQQFLVVRPDCIQEIFEDNGDRFAKHEHNSPSSRGNFPCSVMNSEGWEWHQKRYLLQGLLRPEFIDGRIKRSYEITRGFLEENEDGCFANDLHRQMLVLCARLGFDLLFDGKNQEKSVASLTDMLDQTIRKTASKASLSGCLSSFRFWKQRNIKRKFNQTIAALLNENRTDHSEALTDRLRAHGAQADWLHDETATLLMSMMEPMAAGLTWTLALLANSPQLALRIAAEADQGFDTMNVSQRKANLHLTEAVVKEALRLYPPAWMTGRIAQVKTTLGGFGVPQGTMLLISQWVSHRNPAYFQRPDEFLPERWLKGTDKPRPYAYFPFGGGPRHCLGFRLAVAQMTMVITCIMQMRRLETDGKENVMPLPYPALVLRPSTMKIRLGARSRSLS